MPTRVALGIEYDGSGFCGWQLQPGVRTVQGCLEAALARVADHPVRVTCAGRTDTGVHARGQVVHFDSPAERSPRAWVFGANAHLDADATVVWARVVDRDFHARFAAERRHYRYVIFNRAVRPALLRTRAAWEYRPLQTAAMTEAAGHLLGEHDFSSFRAYACQAKHPVRTVYRLDVARKGEFVTIDIVANAFLHHMVRNIAGVLMHVGAGKAAPLWTKELLEARDRRLGGVNAPPCGLYFLGPTYPSRFEIPAAVADFP